MTLLNTISRVTRVDSFLNFFTGLNTEKDKIKAAIPHHFFLAQPEVEELYASDSLSKRVVNSIPMDGTREWIEYINLDPEAIKFLLLQEKRLKVKSKFTQALIFARLYGGSAIWMVVNDGREVNEPLDVNKMDSIDNLVVLNRWELWIDSTDIQSNAAESNFGMPI